MKWIVLAGMMLIASSAHSKEITMPTDFIGEWCYSTDANDPKPKDPNDNKFEYTLPSWTDDGCDKNKILSITGYSFSFFDENIDFQPISVTTRRDCAPSGCALIAKIVARSYGGKPRTFLFHRHKGRLYIEEAKRANRDKDPMWCILGDKRKCPKDGN